MAANDLAATITSTTTGALDFLVLALIIIFIVVIIGVLIWFVWFRKQFKHKIVLRNQTKGDTDLIISTVYRYVKKKGEAEKIQLWYKKQYKPCPPQEAIDFTTKGAQYCEGWLLPTGEIIYINASDKSVSPLDKHKKKLNVIATDDKEFYANSFFEAQRFKKKDFLSILTDNIGIIALVLIFVITLAFWEEITKPMIQVSNSNAEISQNNAEILASLDSIVNDRQVLEPERLNQTAPD